MKGHKKLKGSKPDQKVTAWFNALLHMSEWEFKLTCAMMGITDYSGIECPLFVASDDSFQIAYEAYMAFLKEDIS